MIYFSLCCGLIIAYLLGSIPTSVWVSKGIYGIDIRTKGSGNAGATNTIRVLGWKAGIPVLLFDVFKGWLAVSIAVLFNQDYLTGDHYLIYKVSLAISAVLGHIFPVYIGFKGGRGVATLLGIGIALYPVAVWLTLSVFIIVLLITRIVSIASVLSAMSLPFIVIFLLNDQHTYLVYLSIAIGVFIPLTHWSNIKRLINGQEKPFKFGKDKDG